ncbi:hypothetical protein SAMN05216490_4428 [Mucilaginibacter mallensis]|uniref:Uncharacterized protein n=1 Tax=Mucilaginibacter mallensis TaxID=652787 RepID=A0A1H2BWQ3_MUCMA|nr:hypothetical protein [Mucilaginibacter mallensis]SDT62770.1 hypothetical protein SAMN05216490_4428 [Mucilaginibacter mallensis]
MESQFTISSIIIIVWLIFPGVVFKRFYYQGQFTKQFGAGLFADRLITSIFWGIIVQIVTFLIFSRSFGFTFTGIKAKVGSVYVNIVKNEMPNIAYEHLKYILGYLFFLVLIAAISGYVSHKVIRIFKIDVKFEVFRFANHWNYYFRGEILSTREFKSLKKGKWLSTMVDVLIDDSTEKSKMVSGFLTQYTISEKTGELETIYLTGAKRYSQTSNQFKVIPGDCMIIPFDKIIDMNLRYTFQAFNKNFRKYIIFKNAIWFSLTIGLLFFLIIPWYLDVNIFCKLLGIISGFFSWVIFVMIVSNPFQPNISIKFTTEKLWPLLVTMVIFLVITLLLLGITPSFEQIKHIF